MAKYDNRELEACMNPDVEQLVRAIHGSSTKAAVLVTGGAAQGASWLLGVPGASSTVLEVVVPYSRGSLMDVLGQEPLQYCSADTALALARAAYRRAAALSSIDVPVVGLSATCALASEPPKRGEHRAYVAAHSSEGTRLLSVRLAKGARSRWQEEQLVSRALLKVLAEACGLDSSQLQLPLMLNTARRKPHTEEHATSRVSNSPSPTTQPTTQPQEQDDELLTQVTASASQAEALSDLLAGRVQCVEFSGGRIYVDVPRGPGQVYLPGSFNPLHHGHQDMLAAAVQMSGAAQHQGCFELTVLNADKEVQRRVSQFVTAGLPLLVTRAPLLVDKARLLAGSTFVLGWDTAVRIVMPKYYGGSDAAMAAVFDAIRSQNCTFLVAGRLDDGGDRGTFKTLSDIHMDQQLSGLFQAIPEQVFRADISSTRLRQEVVNAHIWFLCDAKCTFCFSNLQWKEDEEVKDVGAERDLLDSGKQCTADYVAGEVLDVPLRRSLIIPQKLIKHSFADYDFSRGLSVCIKYDKANYSAENVKRRGLGGGDGSNAAASPVTVERQQKRSHTAARSAAAQPVEAASASSLDPTRQHNNVKSRALTQVIRHSDLRLRLPVDLGKEIACHFAERSVWGRVLVKLCAQHPLPDTAAANAASTGAFESDWLECELLREKSSGQLKHGGFKLCGHHLAQALGQFSGWWAIQASLVGLHRVKYTLSQEAPPRPAAAGQTAAGGAAGLPATTAELQHHSAAASQQQEQPAEPEASRPCPAAGLTTQLEQEVDVDATDGGSEQQPVLQLVVAPSPPAGCQPKRITRAARGSQASNGADSSAGHTRDDDSSNLHQQLEAQLEPQVDQPQGCPSPSALLSTTGPSIDARQKIFKAKDPQLRAAFICLQWPMLSQLGHQGCLPLRVQLVRLPGGCSDISQLTPEQQQQLCPQELPGMAIAKYIGPLKPAARGSGNPAAGVPDVRYYLKGAALREVQPPVVNWYMVRLRKLSETALQVMVSPAPPAVASPLQAGVGAPHAGMHQTPEGSAAASSKVNAAAQKACSAGAGALDLSDREELGLPDELPSANELTPDVVEALCDLVDKLETRFAELEGNQLYDVLANLMDAEAEHRKFMTTTYTFLRMLVKKKDMLKLKNFVVKKVLAKGE
eukprot:gene8030-8226_t